ncbi:FAD binding domain-containing protein [Pleurostoma richardsiae]|uniref:Delta(24)-sterol reductase n=1 Tax=Pleurostoma richardsiae TaxID=41990 RepID=A0AA38RK82_9PEZI|nr:FAD binding domain-containing protein [Pleurostoma richardsiae]
MDQHEIAVAEIAKKVQKFHKEETPYRIYHGSTNRTRPLSHDQDKVIDTSQLSNVIAVDKTTLTVIVEPNVPMDQLVLSTLEHGVIPKVVPEFPGITVGGTFSGTGAESSSFKYGYFDRSVNWAEIVLADGRIAKASQRENADLFNGSVGACGTLGVCTLFEIQLMPSGKYIEVAYFPVYSIAEAAETLDRWRHESCKPTTRASTETVPPGWDFLDAVLYSKTHGVVVAGRVTQSPRQGLRISRFSRRQDQWFYLHAHSRIAHQPGITCDTCAHSRALGPMVTAPVIELVPVFDFLFRYDRGAFWMGSYGWPSWQFNRVGRALLDSLFRTRTLYKAMHLSGRAQKFIIQDIAVPRSKAERFLDWADEKLRIYPLWLCPIAAETQAPLHLANRPSVEVSMDGSLINVGLWGVPATIPVWHDRIKTQREYVEELVDLNRLLEQKTKEVGGLKWLYARNYYSEEQFWGIYDKQKYDELRQRWGAETLPSLWEKVRNRHPEYVQEDLVGALLSMAVGRDHILGKQHGG